MTPLSLQTIFASQPLDQISLFIIESLPSIQPFCIDEITITYVVADNNCIDRSKVSIKSKVRSVDICSIDLALSDNPILFFKKAIERLNEPVSMLDNQP